MVPARPLFIGSPGRVLSSLDLALLVERENDGVGASIPLQWVASPRRGPSAKSITHCTVVAGNGFLPALRVFSRRSPSTPLAHEALLSAPHHRL